MATNIPSALPVAAEFLPSSYYKPGDSSNMEQNDQPTEPDRADDRSPGTVVAHEEEDSDDSTPPVPPVPQNLNRKASRQRVRRNTGHGYISDPQSYGMSSPRAGSSKSSHRPRFQAQDDWMDSDAPYGSDRAWREEMRHPDHYDRRYMTRSRIAPPRSHLNGRPSQMFEPNSKQWVEESRANYDPFSPAVPNFPARRWYDEEHGYGPGGPAGYPPGFRDMYDDGPRIQWNNLTPEQKAEVLRLPWLQWMNSDVKNHFVASLGELVGTALFLFFAFAGTEVANIQSNANNSNNSNTSNTTTGASTGFNVAVLLYISLSFGMSLMVNVWIFFRISGGLFNPAVTLALVLIRAITIVRAICLFIAQIAGGILASVLVRYLFPENFNVRTTLGGGANIAQGIFIEALLTAELVFTIYMLAAEKHRATFIAPVGIGMALFIAELVGVQFTGGSLNPARSFGPCVVTATFDAEHWIYWVGPFLGAIIAWVFYKFIKALEYEMANPGADGDPLNDPTKNPEKMAELRLAKRKSKSINSIRDSHSVTGSSR